MKVDYKKLVRNQDIRFWLLRMVKAIPDKIIVKWQYKLKLGRRPNLMNPIRYTEKIQCYKLYYRNDFLTLCADKYRVREYLKSKGYEHILVPLIGVYDKVEEIPFCELPNMFVIKTTHGSGTNIFCRDKESFDFIKAKYLLKKWLKRDYFAAGREWAYKNIIPRIIIEKLLIPENEESSFPHDYKFLCFNGEVKYIVVDKDRFKSHKRNIYTPEWGFLDISTDHPNCGDTIPKPDNLDEMKAIATTLSQGFPHVRVDLYSVNKAVYFGEMTFYPLTGYVQFEPDEFDKELGAVFCLSSIRDQ